MLHSLWNESSCLELGTVQAVDVSNCSIAKLGCQHPGLIHANEEMLDQVVGAVGFRGEYVLDVDGTKVTFEPKRRIQGFAFHQLLMDDVLGNVTHILDHIECMCEVLGLVMDYVDVVDGKIRDDIGPIIVVDHDIIIHGEELVAKSCPLSCLDFGHDDGVEVYGRWHLIRVLRLCT